MANIRIMNAGFTAPPQPSVSIVVRPDDSDRVCGAPRYRFVDVTTNSEVTLPFELSNTHRGLGGESSVTLTNGSIFRDVTSPGIVSGNLGYLNIPGLDQHNGGEVFVENVNGNIVFKPGTTTIEIQSFPPNTIDLVNKDNMQYTEPLNCFDCWLNDENLGGTVLVVGSLNVNFELNDRIVTTHSYSTGCADKGGGDVGLQPM